MTATLSFADLRHAHRRPNNETIMDLFDSLGPVGGAEIVGKWRGGGFDTGHWLLPALGELKWFGKWIVSETDVKPLVCFNDHDALHSNSAAMNGEATLTMSDFRTKISATVSYNGVPMRGHLRRVDENTLLGAVDGEILPNGVSVVQDERHQFFYLERIEDWPVAFVNAD
jgi:hypothetical protein